ncbi:MAG: MerR family transcriptional regulator [Candidatus Magnetoovum sp. WYHC-5]|nr:MerR family transcriptional regulator [Candidatus Magnetoovum sp. WYHC-5]
MKNDKEQPIYVISVVAQMLGVHPQTLRMYEREGFICPVRMNNQRKYTQADISQLDFVIQLTRDLGVNKAGVDIILRMRKRMEALQNELEEIINHLDEAKRLEFMQRIKNIFQEVK